MFTVRKWHITVRVQGWWYVASCSLQHNNTKARESGKNLHLSMSSPTQSAWLEGQDYRGCSRTICNEGGTLGIQSGNDPKSRSTCHLSYLKNWQHRHSLKWDNHRQQTLPWVYNSLRVLDGLYSWAKSGWNLGCYVCYILSPLSNIHDVP